MENDNTLRETIRAEFVAWILGYESAAALRVAFQYIGGDARQWDELTSLKTAIDINCMWRDMLAGVAL